MDGLCLFVRDGEFKGRKKVYNIEHFTEVKWMDDWVGKELKK